MALRRAAASVPEGKAERARHLSRYYQEAASLAECPSPG